MLDNSPFYERSFTCPVCSKIFKSYAIRSSKVNAEKREPDFHTIYKGVSPLHYTIVVCPSCYYAASNNLFGQEIPDRIVQQLSQALPKIIPADTPDFCHERDLTLALRSYQLGIRSGQLRKARPGELAGLFLGAAWMAREKGEEELEKEYVMQALQSYLEAFNRDFRSIGNMSDVQATYLIGELYRQTGNASEAISWFNKAIFHRNIKQYPQIEKIAREQWALAREMAGEEVPAQDKPSSQEIAAVVSNNDSAHVKSDEPKPAARIRKRSTMQLNASLYPEQIEWLNRIVNKGYDHSKTLTSREQVLRALLDAVMEKWKEDVPYAFKNEEELKEAFAKKLE